MTRTTTQDLRFDAPGGGAWMHDTSHHGRRPVTHFMQSTMTPHFERGMGVMCERYGVPIQRMKVVYIHDHGYGRPVVVGEGDEPRPAPPKPVMWLLTRLHPEMRRRNRAARRAWETRAWRAEVDEWFENRRSRQVTANLELQAEDPGELADAPLAEHLRRAITNLQAGIAHSFESHGGDIIPCGDFIAHCARWGIDATTATSLLRGASPTTTEVIDTLAPAAEAIAAADPAPTTVDEVRALGSEAAAAIDQWLAHHGWRLIASDDVDAPTLAELPDVQLRTLFAVDPAAGTPDPPDPSAVRERVPSDQRVVFDELLAEARYGLRLRDDNVGVNWNWPAGLVRRGLLEAGRRLADTGALADERHVLDLTCDEVAPLLEGRGTPTADEVASRFGARQRAMQADPPDHLGDPMEPPPTDAMPAPMARATGAVFALIEAMQDAPVDEDADGLHGTGIGTEPYRGRACVVGSVEESFERLGAGDVLVTQVTGPAYNSILPIVGGMVVEAGGAMSHAAIVSREFGISSVIGVRGATDRIADGDEVEVDPARGTVRIVGGA